MTSAKDPVAALAALYQGEKTDASYVFNTAMVMMGVAVAYLVGAIPFVGNLSHGPIGWLFVLLLPIPLWLVVAFHSLITLNAMSHGISVRIIEDKLFLLSGLREEVDRELVGSAAGDEIMDITKSTWAHKLTTLVVYAGVGSLVVGFTAYALHAAYGALRDTAPGLPRGRVVTMAAVTYSLLLVMVFLSWIKGLKIINGGRAKIPPLPPTTSVDHG
jgi:hypothetical protein